MGRTIVWTEKESLRLARDLKEWLLADDENIYLNKFLLTVAEPGNYKGKIYKDLFPYLGKRYPKFKIEYEMCQAIEEMKLCDLATHDKVNVQMAKFILSANHGYTEKSEIEVNNNVKIMNIDPLADIDE